MKKNIDVLASRLVAHRGYSSRYPENTLLAIEKALQAGARFVEYDVQLTRDRVPVLLHDADLKRISQQPQSVFDLTFMEMMQHRAAYAQRFGEQFTDVGFISLQKALASIHESANVHSFVEIKRASIHRHGYDHVWNALWPVLQQYSSRLTLISFDAKILHLARERGLQSVGWVFEDWSEQSKATASALQPDYLFTDVECVPHVENPLWQGAWQWAVYEVDELQTALQWLDKGADLVETNAIGDLLQQ